MYHECCRALLTVGVVFLLSGKGLGDETRHWPHVFTVGAVVSSKQRVRTFVAAVERENMAPPGVGRRLPPEVRLNATHILMDSNPIRAAIKVCDALIPSQPYVVIASRAEVESDLAPMAVSFTCGFYKIPVIGLSARESTFSDKAGIPSSDVKTRFSSQPAAILSKPVFTVIEMSKYCY